MRGLAEELGVAVTSIYWHVGGRDKLFDSLVDRLLSEMAHLPIDGDSPVERIASLARSQRRVLIDRQHLLAIAHERDRTPTLFLPIQQTAGGAAGRVGRDRDRGRAGLARGAGSRHIVCGDAVLGGSWGQARGRGSLALGRRLAGSGARASTPVPHRLRRGVRIRTRARCWRRCRARASRPAGNRPRSRPCRRWRRAESLRSHGYSASAGTAVPRVESNRWLWNARHQT